MTTHSQVGRLHASSRRVGWAATLAVIGLTLAFSAAPAAAVTRTPYNTNLVKNGGFEAGAATTGYEPVSVPNWVTYDNMTVVKYGAPDGFPSLAEGARISGGKKFFTMGTPAGDSTTCSAGALQVIRIRGRNAAIDAGRVKIDARAYLGTYGTQPDTAKVLMRFHDSNGTMISIAFSASATGTEGSMFGPSVALVVPSGTRSMTVLLYSQATQGYCDAYFDRISVKLSLL